MKYITSALVIFALLGDQAEAVALTQQSRFSDDLIKSLTEDMAKDEKENDAKEEAAKDAKKEEKAPAKDAKKDEKKDAKDGKKDEKKDAKEAKKDDKKDAKAPAKDAKKEAKKEEQEEIPMDAAAIKAYSSVIADAAEDSEPATPVEYHAVIQDDEKKPHEIMTSDPMGSMIQNEISEIKDASIKAAKEKAEE
jgi:hypothetical protein